MGFYTEQMKARASAINNVVKAAATAPLKVAAAKHAVGKYQEGKDKAALREAMKVGQQPGQQSAMPGQYEATNVQLGEQFNQRPLNDHSNRMSLSQLKDMIPDMEE